MEKLKKGNQFFHNNLVAERPAQVRALMGNIRLQGNRKAGIEEKEKAARLLATKKFER